VCWSEGFNYEVLERVYSKTRFQFHMFDLAGKEAVSGRGTCWLGVFDLKIY